MQCMGNSDTQPIKAKRPACRFVYCAYLTPLLIVAITWSLMSMEIP